MSSYGCTFGEFRKAVLKRWDNYSYFFPEISDRDFSAAFVGTRQLIGFHAYLQIKKLEVLTERTKRIFRKGNN
jgi:hypothetical protein